MLEAGTFVHSLSDLISALLIIQVVPFTFSEIQHLNLKQNNICLPHKTHDWVKSPVKVKLAQSNTDTLQVESVSYRNILNGKVSLTD